jgi:hypothetical protein
MAELRLINRALHQPLAEWTVAFQMPFAAHRLWSRRVPLGVQQHPQAPARRARSRPGIVTSQALIKVVGPSDVSSMAAFARTSQNVYEALHELA